MYLTSTAAEPKGVHTWDVFTFNFMTSRINTYYYYSTSGWDKLEYAMSFIHATITKKIAWNGFDADQNIARRKKPRKI